jgi:CheY-like chemotaxis protein
MPRILVIDDADLVRQVVVRYLTQGGYQEVQTASDGLVGIRLWREWRADLVITDLNMPQISGLEVILGLRSLGPDLPILAMSGDPGSMDELRRVRAAFLLGTVLLLVKPFTQKELLREVATALRTRRFELKISR